MNKEIKTEIVYDLGKTIEILEKREKTDINELKKLSNHGIEDVALYKNLDLISVTVLIYSIYKIITSVPEEDYQALLKGLKLAKTHLDEGNLGRYNSNIRTLFKIISKSNAKIKVHLQDVMHAARIKKSTILLEKGLSIGQAAGLMGLSNWDLQTYAGKTIFFEQQHEKVLAEDRLKFTLEIFGV